MHFYVDAGGSSLPCPPARAASRTAPSRSAAAREYPGRTTRHAAPRFTRNGSGGKQSEGSFGTWALLAIPVTTAGLGVWQIYRKDRKEKLIASLDRQLSEPPVQLPGSVAEVRELDYRRVEVTGEFEHDRELLLGPRTLLREAFDGNAGDPGMQVLTPFVRADTGDRVLVNRGWVPDTHKDPDTRKEGQTSGMVTVTAIVYNPKAGKPNRFVPENNPTDQQWFWMDLEAIAAELGAQPILIEATSEATPPGGYPTGGQTQVKIANDHMQYIVTWFSLSAVTLVLWFLRARPVIARTFGARKRPLR